MATPEAYGSSQARGQTGTSAVGLPHSHSNTRSMPHLPPMLQQHQIFNPLSKAKYQTHILTETMRGS